MSSMKKLESEYDNVFTIENPKTKEKSESEKPSPTAAAKPKSQKGTKSKAHETSEGKASENEKPSPVTAEKHKIQNATKSKNPKRELTDSEYERFVEYEKLRKAIKLPPFIAYHSNSHKRIAFQMEMTPKHLLINPDEPFKVTVKSLLREEQKVIVELDSILFKLRKSDRKFGLKTQLIRVIFEKKTLDFEIVLKKPKEMKERLYENKTLNSMDPIDLAGVVRVYHESYETDSYSYILEPDIRSQLVNPNINAALHEYPIRLTKETEKVKKLEKLHDVILVEFERREKCERNVFEMQITPDDRQSIDPDVPFKVAVKSLAKEKHKLIIDLRSLFYKILNAMGQKDYATQICCTILPGETMDFKIVLRSETEAIDCLKTSTYSETTPTGNLVITHIKCHLKDKEAPHWIPYKPPQQDQVPTKPNSMLVNANEERLDREHGRCEHFSFINCHKETEATRKLDDMYAEHKGSKTKMKKKKKCVIQ